MTVDVDDARTWFDADPPSEPAEQETPSLEELALEQLRPVVAEEIAIAEAAPAGYSGAYQTMDQADRSVVVAASLTTAVRIHRQVRERGFADSREYLAAMASARNADEEPPAGPSVDEHENASVNGRRAVAFVTGRELVAEVPPAVQYVIRGLSVALGTITELDGKPKASGKTTLALHAVRAVLDGGSFLGQPTMQTPVVLLTEQSRASIAPTLRALGLDRDDLHLLTWPDAFGTSWPAMVDAAVDKCERTGARLLVIDTLGQFAGLRGDAENDAGAALQAMAPLQAAAGKGLAVLVTRHDRKAGGDVGESGRGSNAWSGAVDCILALRRPLNPARATIRELEAISRRGDMPSEPVLIELTEAGYVVLGSETAVAFGDARKGILEALVDGEWHGEKEILEGLTDVSRTTLRDALTVLVRDQLVEKGKRSRVTEPYPYRLAATVDGPVDGRQHEPAQLPLTPAPSSSPSVDVSYTSVNGREETDAPSQTTSPSDGSGASIRCEDYAGHATRFHERRGEGFICTACEPFAILIEPEDVDEPPDMSAVLAETFKGYAPGGGARA